MYEEGQEEKFALARKAYAEKYGEEALKVRMDKSAKASPDRKCSITTCDNIVRRSLGERGCYCNDCHPKILAAALNYLDSNPKGIGVLLSEHLTNFDFHSLPISC